MLMKHLKITDNADEDSDQVTVIVRVNANGKNVCSQEAESHL